MRSVFLMHSLFPLQPQWTRVCNGNDEVYFIWMASSLTWDETGENPQDEVKCGGNFCKPRVISSCPSLTNTMSLALLLIISECCVSHFKQWGVISFKIRFMIFWMYLFLWGHLLSFFLTCVNTTECVVLKKVLPSCIRKSITLTDREHQEFFIWAVNR